MCRLLNIGFTFPAICGTFWSLGQMWKRLFKCFCSYENTAKGYACNLEELGEIHWIVCGLLIGLWNIVGIHISPQNTRTYWVSPRIISTLIVLGVGDTMWLARTHTRTHALSAFLCVWSSDHMRSVCVTRQRPGPSPSPPLVCASQESGKSPMLVR